MKKIIIFIVILLFVNIPHFSMEEENFQNLMNNIEHALDSNKISILKNLSSETYTCEQVKEILSTFSLASNRVEAFKILAKQIEDPENKGKIMEVFQYMI